MSERASLAIKAAASAILRETFLCTSVEIFFGHCSSPWYAMDRSSKQAHWHENAPLLPPPPSHGRTAWQSRRSPAGRRGSGRRRRPAGGRGGAEGRGGRVAAAAGAPPAAAGPPPSPPVAAPGGAGARRRPAVGPSDAANRQAAVAARIAGEGSPPPPPPARRPHQSPPSPRPRRLAEPALARGPPWVRATPPTGKRPWGPVRVRCGRIRARRRAYPCVPPDGGIIKAARNDVGVLTCGT